MASNPWEMNWNSSSSNPWEMDWKKESTTKNGNDWIPTPENMQILREQSAVTQPRRTSFLEKVIGAAEVPLAVAGSTLGSIGGGLYGAATGKIKSESDFVKAMEKGVEKLAPVTAPRTEAGQQLTEQFGEFANRYLTPIAPLSEVAALSRLSPVSNMPSFSPAINKANDVASKLVSKTAETSIKPVKAITEPLKAAKAGLYDPVMNQPDLISSTLMRNIGKENAPSVIKGLERTAQTPEVKFSAGQATGNPALAAIEDTMRALNPSGELNLQSAKNRTILANKMRNIAQDELAIQSAESVRKAATEPLYKSLENQVYMGGNELDNILARANASGALSEAKKIAGIRGTKFELPVIEQPSLLPITEGELPPVFAEGLISQGAKVKEPIGITGYLKQKGGINTEHILDITGEKSANKSGATVGLFTKSGRGLDDAVQSAVEGGYLDSSVLNEVDGGVSALSDLIQGEIHGKKATPLEYQGEGLLNQYLSKQEQPVTEIGTPANVPAPRPSDTVIGSAIKGKDLINLKKGIDQAIAKAEPNSPTQIELFNLKKDFSNWMESQSSGFMEANKKFSELSKPINQMKIGKLLSEKLIPATAEETPSSLNAAQLAKALKNKNAVAQKATGFEGAKLNQILTKKQLDTILGINSDASRMAEVQKLGAGYGSPTARRLNATSFIGENFRQKAPTTAKIIDILNHVPLVNYVTKGVGKAGSFIGEKLNASMASELENMLANDPAGVARALRKELDLINNKRIKVDFVNPIKNTIPSGLISSGLPASITQQYIPTLLQTNQQ